MAVSWTAVVIIGLAAWRLARLVREDLILEPLRMRILTRLAGKPPGELLSCTHCLGVWFAAALTLLHWWAPSWGDWFITVWAVAGVVSVTEDLREKAR